MALNVVYHPVMIDEILWQVQINRKQREYGAVLPASCARVHKVWLSKATKVQRLAENCRSSHIPYLRSPE